MALNLACLLPAVVAALLFVLSLTIPDGMAKAFGFGAYYLTGALAAAIFYVLAARLPRPFRTLRAVPGAKAGVLASLLLTALVFVTVKPELRVFSDEAMIAGVSKSMLYEKHGWVAVEGKYYLDGFTPTVRELDKRPFLFPFLAHLVHAATGYRPENLIVLNGLVLFALLLAVFLVVYRRLGPVAAVGSQLLVLAHPAVTLAATSGGLELFAAAALIAALLATARHFDRPSPQSLLLVWASCLALAHARYESVALAAVIAVALFLGKGLGRELWRPYQWLYALTPLFLLTIAWQRLARLDYQEAAAGVAPFSAGNFARNAAVFARGLFVVSDELPYANAVFLLAVGMGGLLLVRSLTGNPFAKESTRRTFLTGAACLAVYLAIMLSFHFSDYRHPAAARYFVLPCLLSSLVPFLFLSAAPVVSPFFGVLFAGTAFLFYHPIAMSPLTGHSLFKTREVAFVRGFLESAPHRAFLAVANDSEMLTMRDWGAVSFKTANREAPELYVQKAHHLFQDMYAVQHIRYADEKPEPGEELRPGYETEPLAELETSGEHYVRISRVTKVPEK